MGGMALFIDTPEGPFQLIYVGEDEVIGDGETLYLPVQVHDELPDGTVAIRLKTNDPRARMNPHRVKLDQVTPEADYKPLADSYFQTPSAPSR